MLKQDLELLRKVSFFSELNTEILEEVSKFMRERFYPKGTIIFLEGEPGSAVYFIKSGQVKISKLSESGKEIIVAILGEGDFFAESTLFRKRSTYPATAEVIEDAVVGMVSNKDLEDLVLKNPEMALEVIRALTSKLMTIQDRIKQLGSNDAVERTIQVLVTLANGHGRKTAQGIELCVKITRQDLAGLVGVTRETISRILSKLNQAKIIDISGKNIIIKDLEGLKNW